MPPGNRIWQLLTLRCRGASELTSQAMDEPLPIWERLALGGHLLACARCRRFRRQLAVVRAACRGGPTLACGDDSSGGEYLSREGKARITAAIHEAASGGNTD